MDGRGRWLDNMFIERLWRSLKYEEVYLEAYADGHEARAGIGAWFAFYNGTRPHQALAGRTPIAVWQAGTNSPGETAANMTLPPAAASLGDAFASPTCPPRQPQQQPLEAA
jgi:putative transposase